MNQQLIELASAYGWILIESKNPYMISFKKEEDCGIRINVYFTKMTITVQDKENPTECKTYYQQSILDFEKILMDL